MCCSPERRTGEVDAQRAWLRRCARDRRGNYLTIDVPGSTSSLPRGLSVNGDISFEAIVSGRTTAYLRSSASFINIQPPASFAGGIVTFSYASDIVSGKVVGR